MAEELRRSLAEGRTWTGRQPSEALATRGIGPGPRQLRRSLERMKAGHRRAAPTHKHEQDSAKAERAGKALESPKAEAAQGSVVL